MIHEGKWSEFIREIPIKKGDFLQIDPGTVHAIKAEHSFWKHSRTVILPTAFMIMAVSPMESRESYISTRVLT